MRGAVAPSVQCSTTAPKRARRRTASPLFAVLIMTFLASFLEGDLVSPPSANAFSPQRHYQINTQGGVLVRSIARTTTTQLHAKGKGPAKPAPTLDDMFDDDVNQPTWNSNGISKDDVDSTKWQSMDDDPAIQYQNPSGTKKEDWEDTMRAQDDGTFWDGFLPENDEKDNENDDDDGTEEWLSTLASFTAEEVEYNQKEGDRAEKARQMQELGFDKDVVANTFDVAVDDSLETLTELDQDMQAFRQDTYIDDDDDWRTIESHTKVEKDDETGDPVRQQMVYVDEHTCIGCTNCAMIAQSTFFMDEEHGRARVFQQWGDDDDTIAVAIETCPVDCIHYVPFDELVSLEKERRGQNINFKARLVSQAEGGGLDLAHKVGGPAAFTAAPIISGNMGSRCNNCPSRGCKDCPMFGVGKNPEFERREEKRKAKIERNRLTRMREEEEKRADL